MQVYNTRRQKSPEKVRIVDEPPESARTSSVEKSFFWRRLPFVATVLILIIGAAFFNVYLLQQEALQAKARSAQQKIADEKFRAELAAAAQKKISLAKEAENVARQNQLFDEKKYFKNLSSSNPGCNVKNANSLTVVLNKKHCLADKAWKPADLTLIDNIPLQKEAATAMQAMRSDAEKAGVGFELTSGFRTFEEQAELHADGGEVGSTAQSIDLVSARAGYSEHQTGLAADLKILDCTLDCFGTTRRYQWLKQNAANYGYIERYPQSLGEITGYVHEPWHWRYVGKDIAESMKQSGIETLEMFLNVSGGDYYKT